MTVPEGFCNTRLRLAVSVWGVHDVHLLGGALVGSSASSAGPAALMCNPGGSSRGGSGHCIRLYITGHGEVTPPPSPHLPGAGPVPIPVPVPPPRVPAGARRSRRSRPSPRGGRCPGCGAAAGVCGRGSPPPHPAFPRPPCGSAPGPGMASGKAAGERRWELVRW